jgi:alpha-tubulin suppressor-like RCC1 family protein
MGLGDQLPGAAGFTDAIYSSTPVPIDSLNSVVDMAGGGAFVLAVRSDSTLWAWGANHYGKLGLGTNTSSTPITQVTGLPEVTAVSAGEFYSVALGRRQHLVHLGRER